MDDIELDMEAFGLYNHTQPVTTRHIADEFDQKVVYDFDSRCSFDALINPNSSHDGRQCWAHSSLDNTRDDSVDTILEGLQQNRLDDTENNEYSIEYESSFSSNDQEPDPIGATPEDHPSEANLLCAHKILAEQRRLVENSRCAAHLISPGAAVVSTPIDLQPSEGGCMPYNETLKCEFDLSLCSKTLQFDFDDPKQIQIQCQPRGKFRPRTQNESRISSHYIRCEDGVQPEYPTINVFGYWARDSLINIIEVALVALDKESHPYSLENKSSINGFLNGVEVFKEQENNMVYFVLSQDDFHNGYKTFQIEYIKAKQDQLITKEYIRQRQLDQSMLRFTRIYQKPDGKFVRDTFSEVYSNVMCEAYGDIEIEHMGPRMGPMSAEEMVYAVLKGRVLKNELVIEVTEARTNWRHPITNFTKNGNVIYFKMPVFPQPEMGHAVANITIFCRGEELFRMSYLYKYSFDEELAALSLNDTQMGIPVLNSQTNFDSFALLSILQPTLSNNSKKGSAGKRTKRLNRK